MALLEEEKGNLQLSLVDFDELKGRNQDRNSVIDVSIVLVMLFIVRAMHCLFIYIILKVIIHNPVFLVAGKFQFIYVHKYTCTYLIIYKRDFY